MTLQKGFPMEHRNYNRSTAQKTYMEVQVGWYKHPTNEGITSILCI